MNSTRTARQAIVSLQGFSLKERAKHNARFFKTGNGEYGEGDEFLGVTVPNIRKVAKEFAALSMKEVQKLVHSRLHEVRLLGVIIWTIQFAHGDDRARKQIFDAYLSSTAFINNWDLVDVSAPRIVGEWLLERDRKVLSKLAKSSLLWDRRIAMVSTLTFICAKDPSTTFIIADIVLNDTEDLMHKATGWMLREVGKRCGRKSLIDFLKPRYKTMPRTTLRYAIEHFSTVERKRWLLGKV